MTPWRDLHRRFPRFTCVGDVEAYADVFDAIDDARQRGRDYVPGPDERKRLGRVSVTDADGSQWEEDFVVAVMPVTPVRIANTVRLSIGLLQRGLWANAAEWRRSANEEPEPTVLLPDVSTLLARKLRPTAEEIADVAAFLLTPWPDEAVDEERYVEPSAPVLRFLEKHVTPPATEPVRPRLIEARRRLALVRAYAIRIVRTYGGKAGTARFDKWESRLTTLIGSA